LFDLGVNNGSRFPRFEGNGTGVMDMKQRIIDGIKIGILIFLQTVVSMYTHKG